MDDIRKFKIGKKQLNDPELRPYEANSTEYTYVASAINLALAMLAKDNSKNTLVDIALLFDNTSLDSSTFQGNRAVAKEWVNWFVNQLQQRFPPVIVDESITHLDCLGYHPRLPWDGRLEDFPFHTQGVHLNAPRVKDMVAAGHGNSQASGQRFRNFQFAFATTIVHEAGPHILLTWLGRGRPDTPPEMAVTGYAVSDDQPGESGRFFELHLFGGTTEYYRDLNQDDSQSGVPHQLDSDGWAWKIKPDAINRLCIYDIEFPFARVGGKVNRLTMQSVGRTSTNPAPSGSRDQTLMAQQGTSQPHLRFLASHSVRVSDLKLVPNNPSQRLVAVA